MTWLIIPALAFIIILCIVVFGGGCKQEQHGHVSLFIPDYDERYDVDFDIDEEHDIECGTSDEPIYKVKDEDI